MLQQSVLEGAESNRRRKERSESMDSGDLPDHVLVVDDDADIRDLLAEYLGQNGIKVTVARDAKEMREVLDGTKPDIIVLDVMMPGEDGLTLCRELRSRSNVPVIMLTARAEEVDRIIGIEARRTKGESRSARASCWPGSRACCAGPGACRRPWVVPSGSSSPAGPSTRVPAT